MRVAASHTIIAIVIAFVAGIIVGKAVRHPQNTLKIILANHGPPGQGEEERMPIDKRPQTNEEAIGGHAPTCPKEGLETTENLHEPSETTKHSEQIIMPDDNKPQEVSATLVLQERIPSLINSDSDPESWPISRSIYKIQRDLYREDI